MDEDDPSSDDSAPEQPAGIRWIMLAILGWGLILALGTYLFGGNQPLLRAGIVIACTLAFLGLWWTALAIRGQRP